MNDVLKTIGIELYSPTSYEVVKTQQGDHNSRIIELILYEQGKEYEIANNISFWFTGYRGNGSAFFREDCIKTEGNRIIITLTNDILYYPGTIEAKIVMYDTPNHSVLSTIPFQIVCIKTPCHESSLTQSEKSIITDLIFKVEESSQAAAEILKGAVESAASAANSANSAKSSEEIAEEYKNTSIESATSAANCATTASEKAEESSISAQNAEDYSLVSRSYAVGEGDVRENESVDNAKYYYEQAKRISQGLKGSLLPMGTISFSQLNEQIKQAGYMYNINDNFVTDETFKEGSGHAYPPGTNVYYTVDGYWDCLAGVMVTSVNGENGDVLITPESIGALPNTMNTTINNAYARANSAYNQANNAYARANNIYDAIYDDNLSLGRNANAYYGSYATSLGAYSYTSGNYSTALGYNANASNYGGTALGYNTHTSDIYSTAVGYNASASMNESIALGSNANATNYSIALGSNANASNSSVTLGVYSHASSSSIALGYCANANAYGSSLGSNASANSYSVALGNNAKANGNASTSIGVGSNAYGNYSTALGYKANAIGGNSVSLGFFAKANVYATSLGYYSSATATNSTALGRNTIANGNYSTALGYYANVQSNYSTALGYYATIAAANANTIQLGNASSLSTLSCRVALSVTSDERDKADITEIEDGALEFLNKIHAIRYVFNHRELYIDEETLPEEEKEKKAKFGLCEYDKEAHEKGTKKGSRMRVGVSAQEVQKALAEIYGDSSYANLINDNLFDINPENIPEGVENQLTANYEGFIPFLIKAVQELSQQLSEKTTTIDKLDTRMQILEEKKETSELPKESNAHE